MARPAVGSVEHLERMRKAARAERDAVQPLRDEINNFLLPYRHSGKNGSKGAKRIDKLFDSTALESATRFAGKLHEDLWAIGGENYTIEVGPVLEARAEFDETVRADNENLGRVLSQMTKITGAAFLDGSWDGALGEACFDLLGGDGAILVTPSVDGYADFQAVSIDELMYAPGAKGKVGGIFWTRKMALDAVEATWPEGTFTEDFMKMIEEKPEAEIEVNQDCVYDRSKKKWLFVVWAKENGKSNISYEETFTCPWITAAYFKIPGELYGRGLGHLAMPTIKTLNKAAQISLMAGAIAMLGIYTAIDDGVFNPDNARVEPGSFWKVARNGGPLGPSVQRFPDPRIDLQNIILNEFRLSTKSILMDQGLPPDTAAVRSATEILERMKRLAADHQGAFGRLINGINIQAVRRVIEIGYDKGYFPFAPSIDQLLVKVRVSSPMALARAAAKAQAITQYLEMVTTLLGDRRDEAAKFVPALLKIAKLLGIDGDLIPTDAERKQIETSRQMEQVALAAAQATAQGAAAGAADPFSSQNEAPPPEMQA